MIANRANYSHNVEYTFMICLNTVLLQTVQYGVYNNEISSYFGNSVM